MDNHPAPAPPTEYRLLLNNWLQERGWNERLEWDDSWSTGPEHSPTWHAVCRFDGVEYGRGMGRTVGLAKEEASFITLRRLHLREVMLALIRRRQNQSAPQPPTSPPTPL